MSALQRRVFRANPAFEFVPAAQLASLGFQSRARGTRRVVYSGALRPLQERWFGARAIDPVLHAIWRALQKPGHMPVRLRKRLGEFADRELAKLVLDGVLQVEHDGAWLSGGDGLQVFPEFEPPRDEQLVGVAARLSLAALRYGASLSIEDAERLGARLYFHHRYPATPAWRHRIPDPAACERFLRVEPGASLRARLERRWVLTSSDDDGDGWMQWWPRRAPVGSLGTAQPCKVFVSPPPRVAPTALEIVVGTLETLGAPPFKVGRGLHGLLRPDKIVVYFARYPDMIEGAQSLARALAGLPAHGVPFSAAVDEHGLVSWGLDPWNADQPLRWRQAESWRMSVTARLARSLLIARHTKSTSVAPERFALARIALDNIDPVSWEPRDVFSAGETSAA